MSVRRSTLWWFGSSMLVLACGGDDGGLRSESEPTSSADAAAPGSVIELDASTAAVGDARSQEPQGNAKDGSTRVSEAGETRPPAQGRDGGASAGDDGGARPPLAALDCGKNGVAIENAGPPSNRVNYVIVGDGYKQSELDTLYVQHIRTAMTKRFSPIGEPYARYRKFVNICAIKLPSDSSPIGSGATALSCTGDDQSRLARCNEQAANNAIKSNLPASFEVDWKAVVLNNDRWWNTGSVLMLWSGAHKSAAGAALHEGGHGFHQLADEYGGTNGNCAREYNEINSTADMTTTAGKWDKWLNYDQTGATGKQGVFAGSRYCDADQYRPSSNSMMNSLFGDNPNTSYNAISREKMIMDIWRIVKPIDATEPPAGAVSGASTLTVRVVDPAVVDVDWSVDGKVVAEKGGESFDLKARGLSAGMHTVTAKAYDNAGEDLVRYRDGGNSYGRMNWARSQQTVSWTVTIP